MTDEAQRLETIDRFARELATRGIVDYWIDLSVSDWKKVVWREGRAEETLAALDAELVVGLYLDGRYCEQRTTDLRPAALGDFAERSISLLRVLPRDPHRVPVDHALQGAAAADLRAFSEAVPRTTAEQRQADCAAAWDAAVAADPRVAEVMAERFDSVSGSTRAWSGGFSHSASATAAGLYAVATLRADDGARPTSWYGAAVRDPALLPAPAEIGRRAAERVVARLGEARERTGRYDLVVSAEVADYLVDLLVRALSGWEIHGRGSCLEHMIGQSIASSRFTLVDDPLFPGSLGARLCDADGLPAERRVLVEGGSLRAFFADWYISRVHPLPLTTRGPSCLRAEAAPGTGGAEPLEALLAGAEGGLLVTGFNGGNSNPLTGDFSIGVSGFSIAGGTADRPFNEMVLSGNLSTFFSTLDGIGDDPWPYGDHRLPSLRFRSAVVAGG
jgi:PmbA protein